MDVVGKCIIQIFLKYGVTFFLFFFYLRLCINCFILGECLCHTYYHGAFCDIDERTPLIVNDLEGGGQCDIADGEECKCFTVRTENPAIESFSCTVQTYMVVLFYTTVHFKSSNVYIHTML